MADANLGDWTAERTEKECAAAHDTYAEKLRQRHRQWPSSPQVPRSSVFPYGCQWLADALAPDAWHEYWCQGGTPSGGHAR